MHRSVQPTIPLASNEGGGGTRVLERQCLPQSWATSLEKSCKKRRSAASSENPLFPTKNNGRLPARLSRVPLALTFGSYSAHLNPVAISPPSFPDVMRYWIHFRFGARICLPSLGSLKPFLGYRGGARFVQPSVSGLFRISDWYAW